MMPKIIAIAGGSGAGKSSLTVRLCQQYPHIFRLVEFDDYSKPWDQFPLFAGFPNRVHPDSQRFEDFKKDLMMLQEGKSITVATRSAFYNPEYKDTKERRTVCIDPAPIILAEGFLTLHDPSVRALVDRSVFLDIPIAQSIQRIDKVYKRTVRTPEYIEQVLKPMYEQFVFPTKQYADFVIDVTQRSAENVHDVVLSWIHLEYPALFPHAHPLEKTF